MARRQDCERVGWHVGSHMGHMKHVQVAARIACRLRGYHEASNDWPAQAHSTLHVKCEDCAAVYTFGQYKLMGDIEQLRWPGDHNE